MSEDRRTCGRGRAQEESVRRPRGVSDSSNTSRQDVGYGRASFRPPESSSSYSRPAMGRGAPTPSAPPDRIVANYFSLRERPDISFLHYHVDFAPEIEHPAVRNALIRAHREQFGKYMFHGTTLYTTTRLPQPNGNPLELVSRRLSDNTDVKITIKFATELGKHDPEYDMIMNIIVRRCMKMLDLVEIRRQYFDPQAKQDLPNHPITIWPGYSTSVRLHQAGFLMNVDIKHKFLRRDTAYNVMETLRRQGTEDIAARMKAELVGKVVMTHYNNKTYRIDDVDLDTTPRSTFHLKKEDRQSSYMEYYQTRYNIRINQPNQPMLVSRPTRRDRNRGDDTPIYLVPELCHMTGLAVADRENFSLTSDIARITRVNPDRRVQNLLNFRRRLADTPRIQEELNNWGVQFANDLVTCQAKYLPPMYLVPSGGAPVQIQGGDWARNLFNQKMPVISPIQEWLVLYPVRMERDVVAYIALLKEVGARQGFNIPEPNRIAVEGSGRNDVSTVDYTRKLRNELSTKDYTIVMCVTPQSRNELYKAIKDVTLNQFGVLSQVITTKVFQGQENRRMSTATKVMMQIACKVGAEPWHIQVPAKNWMIAGYDTYHDARQQKAVGAFVASVNKTFTRYHSSVMTHENNEEISPSFRAHTLKSLRAYYIANQCLPETIILYRDGVGAGDVNRVRETELSELREACKQAGNSARIEGGYRPGIVFIVVSKRINTRFFGMRGQSVENPPCGTVIDSEIPLSDRQEFFLVSQRVNQGTVSPTNFNVIHNAPNIPIDILQKCSYALTHLYYNWTGTVRVPAPVQYAHKLAYLIGEKLATTRIPEEKLEKFPYYL